MTASTQVPTWDQQLPPVEFIAGLDAMTVSERSAEHLLTQVVAAVESLGARQITAATHRVQVFETAHVAMSIGLCSTVSDAQMSAVLADAVAAQDGIGGAIWIGLSGNGLPALQAGAQQAAKAHSDRSSGRVVRFPGGGALIGSVTFEQLMATSIDLIQGLGGDQPDLDAVLVTRDFLRPRWQAGQLVLHVQPAAGGTWVPFETPNPTPCCAAHG